MEFHLSPWPAPGVFCWLPSPVIMEPISGDARETQEQPNHGQYKQHRHRDVFPLAVIIGGHSPGIKGFHALHPLQRA